MPRGPYFRYLVDPNEEVPDATLRRWNNHNVNNPQDGVEDNAAQQENRENEADQDSASSGHSSPHSEMHFSSGRSSPHSEMHFSSGRSSSHSDMQESSDSDMSAHSYASSISDGNVSDHDEHLEDHNSDAASQSSHSVSGSSNSDISFDDDFNGSDYGDDIPQNARIPMYDGCRITVEESRLLILAFALRFGLSDKAIEHLLQLINCHLPSDEHASLYLFEKHLPVVPLLDTVKTEFICSEDKCQRLVRFEDGVNNVECECGVQCNKATLKKEGHCFLTLPLRNQIVSLFQNRDLCDRLRWENRRESDVISGRVYQQGIETGNLRKDCDITLQFNTDGVKIFATSSIQVWPIQVAVNELPYKIRRDNIMLCGLWYGQGKPNMNAFLLPFVDELNDLSLNGLLVPTEPPRLIRVHTLVCSVDSMARAPLQNLKTFRGAYGCGFCLHPGEEYAVGRGKTRLYRGGTQQARTSQQHHEDLTTLLERRRLRAVKAIRGIKGPSVLMTLPNFHISQSFVPEYLHCVLLGVVKTMFEFWSKGANHRQPYYIGKKSKLNAIDSVLLTIKPPQEITKTPRTIHSAKLWRGHEWKNFLLYYSIPCLKAVKFPAKYLNHWFLLVFSMSCFLSDLVTTHKFEKGTLALRKFVLTLEDIYGTAELMKSNTHLLLHIPKSVKYFGALWGSSTFPFEHYNGLLGKMFRSSQSVPLQICKNYVRLQGLKEELATNIARDNRVPQCMKKLLESLACGKKSRLALRVGQDLMMLGAPRYGVLTLVQQNLIENLLNAPVNNTNGNVQFWNSFIYKNVMHHTDGCPTLEKRINCVVQINDGEIISISHALKITTVEDVPRTVAVFLGFRMQPTADELCQDRQLRISSNSFMTVVRKTTECVAILPHVLGRKCVLTFFPDGPQKNCCYPLVNLVERD